MNVIRSYNYQTRTLHVSRLEVLKNICPLLVDYHPYIYCLYPIFLLFETYIFDLSIWMAIRPVILGLLLTAITYSILEKIVKNRGKAAILLSIGLILFFSYGYFRTLFLAHDFFINRHREIVPLWLVIFGFTFWLVAKKLQESQIVKINQFLAVTGILLVLIPTTDIINVSIRSLYNRTKLPVFQTDPHASFAQRDELPDIYYIILDGYGREDILADLYDYDNSEFIDALESRGFFVADDSCSNYVLTSLSIPSSLNMGYLPNKIAETYGEDFKTMSILHYYISHSRAAHYLQDRQYEFITIESGCWLTEITEADQYLSSSTPFERFLLLNDLENLIINSSIIQSVGDILAKKFPDSRYQLHRNRILFGFNQISKLSTRAGNHFVFLHLIAPHYPYVFDQNGEPKDYTVPYTLAGGFGTAGECDNCQRYTDEIKFINKKVLIAIDNILANSNPPPIIIIQADHGPAEFSDLTSLSTVNIPERFSILNAYYLGAYSQENLYESITPANSFRVVFNTIFETDFDIREDKSFFSTWVTPFDLVEVNCVEQ